MKTANQLTFATYEASLKLNPNDPVKIIFDNIDWSFVHSLAKGKYSSQGAEGYDPVCLFKAQLLIYLGEVSSNRKLASALVYNTRLCLLCGFNFLETPSNGTFTNFRHRLGDDIFYECLHQLIAQAIALKVIIGGDTAIDSTHLWAYANRFGKKTCSCKGKCKCLFSSSCSLSSYGRTFYLHPERNYRLIGPIPRGSDIWQEKYNARTSVERAYSEEKGSHRLANPRVRGLSNVKIHVYLALCAQVIKRIGAAVTEGIIRPHPVPCTVGA